MVKLSELIHNNSKKILDYFTQAELKRLKETYQQFKDDHIIKKISSHNIILTIPKGFKIIADSSDFTWMISESPKNTMGIFIYEYAIKDSSQYSNEYILQKRDSMLKNNCPGSVTGSWMTTEHNLPVVSQKIMNNNILMFELRGQWKVQNDFMKGPFISLTALDNKRNKAITVEGYVYAPKSEKAEFIRQLEGVLYSFKYLQ
jgi:hypothetical protein